MSGCLGHMMSEQVQCEATKAVGLFASEKLQLDTLHLYGSHHSYTAHSQRVHSCSGVGRTRREKKRENREKFEHEMVTERNKKSEKRRETMERLGK